MSRCIMFEPTAFDTSKLKEFGEITYLFTKEVGRRPLRDQMLECQIINRLQQLQYDPTLDLIVMTGSQLTLLIFATTAVSGYGAIQTLVFDILTRSYNERSMGHLSMISEHGYGVV